MVQKKIMVVDDEPDIVKSVSNLLEKQGYVVTTARNGVECLKKLPKSKPDLILMDFFMPEMSGRETIVKIREKPAYDKVKIVFMTVADFRERGMQNVKQLRVSALISKPLSMKQLTKKVLEVLRE